MYLLHSFFPLSALSLAPPPKRFLATVDAVSLGLDLVCRMGFGLRLKAMRGLEPFPSGPNSLLDGDADNPREPVEVFLVRRRPSDTLNLIYN